MAIEIYTGRLRVKANKR